MITVIIPTLNEENTIRQVIQIVKKSKIVSEIIVVDDKSLDKTIEEANQENVRIMTSTKLGKGASMRDGMLMAKNDILVYLDADIINYPEDIIEKLTDPILTNRADFVKATFDRQAGRVTELAAKPLISILFPKLSIFSQPLSGMISGKREFFKRLKFENDYGVDIGILIDMHLWGARIEEVNIGRLENRMQSWEQLGKMSREVSRAILKRAKTSPVATLETFEHINIVRNQMDFAIKESLLDLKKMVIFDMDNTILSSSFISTASKKFGFEKELIEAVTNSGNPFIRTKKIARLLRGRTIDEILNLVDEIPFVNDTVEVISKLKTRGYICGLISDSYDCVTNHIKNKIGLDFSLGNELEFSNSIVTGEVKIPSFFLRTRKNTCEHDLCKGNALLHVAKKYKIETDNIIAIGDGDNDICMVKLAGIGVSFCATSNLLNLVADKIITVRSFSPLLEMA